MGCSPVDPRNGAPIREIEIQRFECGPDHFRIPVNLEKTYKSRVGRRSQPADSGAFESAIRTRNGSAMKQPLLDQPTKPVVRTRVLVLPQPPGHFRFPLDCRIALSIRCNPLN